MKKEAANIVAGSDPAAFRRLVVAIETFLGR
jgi:hypothetical protein